MCSRDDDPSQHDLPRIDWQANIDAALADVRAMSEALVFARAEIASLRKIEKAARALLDAPASSPGRAAAALRIALDELENESCREE